MVLTQKTLPVMEAFYTIQGEGFHQGKAAYFIRLGGCDVECFWCDVKESWDALKHPQIAIEEIVEKAKYEAGSKKYKEENNQQAIINNQFSGKNIQHQTSNIQPPTSNLQHLSVITGGEPLMHNLDELTHQLHEAGFQTNIETSGSHPLSGEWAWICLSPKKFKAPLNEVIEKANELKVVIYNKSDFKWAEEFSAQVSTSCKLYLQPEWSKHAEVVPMMIDYIKQNPKWELSLQIHKYINVP